MRKLSHLLRFSLLCFFLLTWFQSDVAKATEHPTMLLISDLYFNPFHDPKKVKELSAAPAKNWEAIFARGDSASQAMDSRRSAQPVTSGNRYTVFAV
jgi:hypothetical protein